MSKYDPDDGYKSCVRCGELTSDPERICPICKGEIVIPKRKSKGLGRKPTYYQPGNPTHRKHNHSFD